MILKLSKVINCSSEHPSYPASNLLVYPPRFSWRCAKPNELIATVTFQLSESSCITGLEIGNYRSCIVTVEASTSQEPDKWLPIVSHQFLSYDEAVNSKFKTQVQIFTKRELNPETLKVKFDRVKAICMQSANPRELFGLEFIVLQTELVLESNLDIFGRFKLKAEDKVDKFKNKGFLDYLESKKKNNYKDKLKEQIAESGLNNFAKKQEENREPKKRPLLEKLEAEAQSKLNTDSPSNSKIKESKKNRDESLSPVARTLFGDVIPNIKPKKEVMDSPKVKMEDVKTKKRPHDPQQEESDEAKMVKKASCSLCNSKTDELCKTCHLLVKPKPLTENVRKKPVKVAKPKKEFKKLFEDVSFALSGYVNPQREEIRKKALKMGGKYIVDPNITNNKCTHLICAFKNTPKAQQLKGHTKIVGHKFIEDCFNKKTRLPWRRYALDSADGNQPESEEEIEGSTSPIRTLSIYEQETDDSDSNY